MTTIKSICCTNVSNDVDERKIQKDDGEEGVRADDDDQNEITVFQADATVVLTSDSV